MNLPLPVHNKIDQGMKEQRKKKFFPFFFDLLSINS